MISMIKVKRGPVPPLGEGTSGTWAIKACQVREQIAGKPRVPPKSSSCRRPEAAPSAPISWLQCPL